MVRSYLQIRGNRLARDKGLRDKMQGTRENDEVGGSEGMGNDQYSLFNVW